MSRAGHAGRPVCDHRPVIPLVLVVAGGAALAAGWLLLRGLGPGARVGRIIAATRVVPVAQARALAEQGPARYVGVQGRVDAAEPFEDEHGRPLVLPPDAPRAAGRAGAGSRSRTCGRSSRSSSPRISTGSPSTGTAWTMAWSS